MLRRSLLRIVLLSCITFNAIGQIATDSQIAAHPVWEQLFHIRQTPVTGVSQSFYLAADGSDNSLAELQATLAAFQQHPQSQCRYPARRLFLQRYYPARHFPVVACAEYQAYLDAFVTDSLSLIYASGYLGNPASMFGHVFVKFNSDGEHDLLDNTFSYGASVPESDNKLAYMIKGISGGYEGHFTNQKYHHHDLTYNESELRNLWEYRLDLDRPEVEFILAHLWELENTSMTYYFFRQNCAYQLAKLLELVIDTPLTEPGKYQVMPVDLIMRLNKSANGEPLYTEVRFHGSRQQALYEHYLQLNAQQRNTLTAILAAPAAQTTRLLAALEDEDAKAVIDTLYDYVAFQEVRQDEAAAELHEKKRLAMARRFAMAPGKVQWQSVTPIAPHHAQLTSLLQTGLSVNNNVSAVLLRYRANYYDLLTYNPGRIPFSELSTFDLRLAYRDNHALSVQQFNLLKVINLNASQTGLPGDDALAWKMALGYRQQSNACLHCGSAFVEGFVGKAWSPAAGQVFYGAVSGTATSSNRMGGNLAAGAEMGGVITFTPKLAMSFSAGHQWYINALSEHRQYVEVETRWLISQHWDLRATYQYLGQAEAGVQISYYY